jgi:MazG family protein
MSESFNRLVSIMDRLRDPGGCPWDREQTLDSLAPYFLEEAYEVVDAIASGDADGRIAREKGWFDVDAVCDAISDKMVRRHPHVFGEREVNGADEVIRNWEEIKRDERKKVPGSNALGGVPAALPALLKAYRMTEKAAAVGFDWRRPADVMEKMREEMDELAAELERDDGNVTDRVRAEMGDVLFVMANLARHLGVDPETALQSSNASFQRRFSAMEQRAAAQGRDLREMSLAEQDELWEQVKMASSDPIRHGDD